MNFPTFHFSVFLAAFILFWILTPGILGRFPPKGGKMVVNIVHALIFATIFSLLLMFIKKNIKEGQTNRSGSSSSGSGRDTDSFFHQRPELINEFACEAWKKWTVEHGNEIRNEITEQGTNFDNCNRDCIRANNTTDFCATNCQNYNRRFLECLPPPS